VKELAASITEWVGRWNENPTPYVWRKTADEIFDSLAAYCQRISEFSRLGQQVAPVAVLIAASSSDQRIRPAPPGSLPRACPT
jgi:hypothetical protein